MTLVRPARLEDVDTLARFNIEMALETENKVLDPAVITAGVRRFIEDPSLGFYLVAEDTEGGYIAGCLAVTFEWSDWRNGLFFWIQSVYVEPAARARGVFSALYEAVRARAADTPDVCGLRLYVEKDNVRAQRTYARLGMTETDYRLYEVLLD